MQTADKTCRLCGETAQLLKSHVVPRFVFKWLRRTSGTGHLRSVEQPNLRVQDGIKRKWLCRQCEDIFQVDEQEFANNAFFPLVNGESSRIDYQEWMMRFCVSLTWRTALAAQQESDLRHCSSDLRNDTREAMTVWRDFLLRKVTNPGPFQQHFLPLSALASPHPLAPPSINRYLLRSVDLDVLCSPREAIVWVKLPFFLILGWVKVQKPFQWKGTRLRVRKGQLLPGKTVLPGNVLQQLFDRAKRHQDALANISDTQEKKIDDAWRQDLDRAAESGSYEAMRHDVRLFGRSAFKRKR